MRKVEIEERSWTATADDGDDKAMRATNDRWDSEDPVKAGLFGYKYARV